MGILKSLGPGLIIAGSVVGSGELIATTKTGAEAGISLLWLILIGCVIKVFVQIELGRYAICHGETTLAALDRVPGPRLRVSWIIWYWLAMVVAIQFQLGAIIGGVGQSLALAMPITGDYNEMITLPSTNELRRFIRWEEDASQNGGAELARQSPDLRERIERGQKDIAHRLHLTGERGVAAKQAVAALIKAEQAAAAVEKRDGPASPSSQAAWKTVQADAAQVKALIDPKTWDDRYWSIAVALLTVVLLYRGRYALVQNLSTALVVGFTFVTVGNVIALQNTPQWHISADQFLFGLSFSLPEATLDGRNPLITALATFGIIGVGASELVAYPYWCLEKGYAKYAGVRSDDPSWRARARGWMYVMHYDAFASMVIYTIATLAFFLMGVAVMRTQGLNPEGMRMVGTLLEQYVPVFGEHARWLFLVGAFAVLYSTVLAADASFARMFTDSFKVFGAMDHHNQATHDRSVRILSVVLPLLQLGLYWTGFDPVELVLLGGTMQALMLPMLGFAALYFRYFMCDERLKPSRLWDAMLVISCIGLLIAGAYIGFDTGGRLIARLVG